MPTRPSVESRPHGGHSEALQTRTSLDIRRENAWLAEISVRTSLGAHVPWENAWFVEVLAGTVGWMAT